METLETRMNRLQERARQAAEEVLHHPAIKDLLSEQSDVNAAQLIPDLSKLLQYVRDKQSCAACPGLELCPNDFQGHYCKLQIRQTAKGKPEILDQKAPCEKFLIYNRQLKINKRIQSFYIDEQHLSAAGYDEVEMMSKDRQRAAAVKQIYDYIESVKEKGLQSTGLYLEGQFGTGKTYLAGYLLQELAIAGYTGVIVYMPDFVEDLKSMISDNQKLKETVETLKNCDVLVFDDIGAENMSPWVRDHILGSILNYRMQKKPTLYTSNFNLTSLQKHLAYTGKEGIEENKAIRIMERIAPYVDVVAVKGANHRGI